MIQMTNMTEAKIEVERIARFTDGLIELEKFMKRNKNFQEEFKKLKEECEELRNHMSLVQALIHEYCE